MFWFILVRTALIGGKNRLLICKICCNICVFLCFCPIKSHFLLIFPNIIIRTIRIIKKKIDMMDNNRLYHPLWRPDVSVGITITPQQEGPMFKLLHVSVLAFLPGTPVTSHCPKVHIAHQMNLRIPVDPC